MLFAEDMEEMGDGYTRSSGERRLSGWGLKLNAGEMA